MPPQRNAMTQQERPEVFSATRFRPNFPWLLAALLLGVLASLAFAQTPPAADSGAPQDEPVTPRVKAAVERALAFLKTQQRADGSFEAGDAAGTTAVPSLVVMAYLAHGDVPGQGPYGNVIDKAIDYVLDSQRPDGIFARDPPSNIWMYENGISTVMVSEAYGMVDDARRGRIDKALAKSVALILAAQKARKQSPIFDGGWRYRPDSPDSDISCTGWQLMALRGAANCGAAVPPSALQAGLDYVRRSAVAGGGFAYQPGQSPNQARTGTGILAMELLGKHNTPEALAGGEFLLTHPPDNPNIEFYYYAVYYCAQATNQLGGKYYADIYPKLCQTLLAQQQRDGSFTGGGASQEQNAGPAYRTAMSCLALSVPYRYLPLYQK
jgi:hypothetical protein